MERTNLTSSAHFGATYPTHPTDNQIFKDYSPVDKTATVAIDYFQAASKVKADLKERLIEIDPDLVGESRWGSYGILSWIANALSGWWNATTAAPLKKDWEVLQAMTQDAIPTLQLVETLKRYDSSRDYDKEHLKHLVFKTFRIAPTKFERTYPPVGRMDTRVGNKNQNAQVQLSDALEKYAKKNDIKLPNRAYGRLAAQVETIFPHLKGLNPDGSHGYGNSYKDHEILHIYPPNKEEQYEEVTVRFTNHGKPIIQQQATRGCTAGVTAMLIYEKTKKFNVSELFYRNLGTDATVESDFRKAGVSCLKTKCDSPEALQAQIKEHGSAIVTVDSIGGHVVIVDEITSQSVRIRDPYHGWEVDIERSAFETSWSKSNTVFQVAK